MRWPRNGVCSAGVTRWVCVASKLGVDQKWFDSVAGLRNGLFRGHLDEAIRAISDSFALELPVR